METKKSTFENVNDLIRALLWPLIVVIVFLAYRKELNQIIALVPKTIENSSKVSVGSLSFEIERTARITGDGALAEVITNLSDAGIRKLLTLSSSQHMIVSRNSAEQYNNFQASYSLPLDYDVLIELEQKKLIIPTEPLDEFLKFFKGLKHEEEKVFRSKNGGNSTSTVADADFRDEVILIKVLDKDLGQHDRARIERMGVALSESGSKAFDIVVKVISEQINKSE